MLKAYAHDSTAGVSSSIGLSASFSSTLAFFGLTSAAGSSDSSAFRFTPVSSDFSSEAFSSDSGVLSSFSVPFSFSTFSSFFSSSTGFFSSSFDSFSASASVNKIKF